MVAARVTWMTLLAAACGPHGSGSSDGGTGGDAAQTADAAPQIDAGPQVDASPPCETPGTPAGAEAVIAPEFADLYTAYDLGTVPGVPNPLGGAAVKISDEGKLLIAGSSENGAGAIYEIAVDRDACGHILGWVGTAQLVANTPYVDANLVYFNSDLMVYTQWPQFRLDQLPVGASAPARSTDLLTIGMDTGLGDQGPGGIGLVPPGLAGAGELRLVTWPQGRWYHVTTAPDGNLLTVSAVNTTTTLANNPGGFAYVPAGSPGFDAQAIIVAEWRVGDSTLDRVAVYDADAAGDPMPATRREFFSKFPRPWGAYFEPVTGDYLFLSWGTGADHVYIVQGFVPPPVVD